MAGHSSQVLLLLVCLTAIQLNVESATTPATTTTTTVTTPAATTTTTTTSATTTTTTPPFTPPEVPSETDITNCTCDLTANACDINCCCDIECEADDRLAFSYCYDTYSPETSATCVKDSIIFRENTPYTTEKRENGLFCVQVDNYEKRNFYTPPAIVETEQKFNELLEKYQTFSLAPVPFDFNLTKSFYQSGDPVYVIYDAISLGYLHQPAPAGTSMCLDTNPVAFMMSKNPTCVRRVSTLAVDCMTLPTLAASMYYEGFMVVPTPDLFSTVQPDNITMGDLETIYTNSSIDIVPADSHICIGIDGINTTCSFNDTDIPFPTFSLTTGVCSNVISKVSYDLVYDGTAGIDSITVTFTFRDINADSLPLAQEFETIWHKPGENSTFRRSGNPGYLLGAPVLAGDVIQEGEQFAISLNSDRNSWYTIPTTTTAEGLCGTARRSVTFGENQRSGCFIQMAYDNVSSICQSLDVQIKDILRLPTHPTRVGSFGNSSTSTPGDWVEIIPPEESGQQATPGPMGQCNNLVTGLDIQIIYGAAGELGNPQNRIVGVKEEYIRRTVLFQCFGPYCQPSNSQLTQKIEIASSVTFVDATQEAVEHTAPVPKVNTRLPEDFFYPFKF